METYKLKVTYSNGFTDVFAGVVSHGKVRNQPALRIEHASGQVRMLPIGEKPGCAKNWKKAATK